jgi:Glycosyl transferase family 2
MLPPTPLSIVVACKAPWPHIEPCLVALLEQSRVIGAEVIVADGCGESLPNPLPPPYADVIHLIENGAGSFRLRSLGFAHARGEIVAVTEDHCVVHAGWCARILQAHAEHPSTAAIGGAVENGTTRHLVDWASFFIANGPFMRPLRSGESAQISLQANISYKRRVLRAVTRSDLGLMEMLFNQELRRRSETLVADDRIVVDHLQCLPPGTFCMLHFHNGRCIAGFRLEQMSAGERLVRLGGCAVLPPYMLFRTLQTVFRKRRLVGRSLVSVPWMIVLLSCHAAGEFLGYITGPGSSPTYEHIG